MEISEGHGGDGKSLLTILVAAPLEGGHKYADSLFLNSAEEFRKSGSILFGALAITFCESNDLALCLATWKRLCTGEPIAIRPPYATKTVMTRFRAMMRYELNRPFRIASYSG